MNYVLLDRGKSGGEGQDLKQLLSHFDFDRKVVQTNNQCSGHMWLCMKKPRYIGHFGGNEALTLTELISMQTAKKKRRRQNYIISNIFDLILICKFDF